MRARYDGGARSGAQMQGACARHDVGRHAGRDARRPFARPDERLRARSDRPRARSADVPPIRRISRRLGDRQRQARLPRDSRACAAASKASASKNVLLFDGLLKITVSQGEARAGDLDRAVATLDEALTTTERAGFRTLEAELHEIRGEILLKSDPSNPAPAEEALQSAIAIARRQKARSFELRAALSLAKLYQSTGRPAEAHAVLASALEGFAPTPEFPEIEEALALLAALEPGTHL